MKKEKLKEIAKQQIRRWPGRTAAYFAISLIIALLLWRTGRALWILIAPLLSLVLWGIYFWLIVPTINKKFPGFKDWT